MSNAPHISRRTFLRRTTTGVLFLSAAKVIPGVHGWAAPPGLIPGTLSFFSPDEFLLMQTIAARITGYAPGEGEDAVDIALRADQYLSTAEPDVKEDFHLLLTLFNSGIIAFLVDFRFSTFMKMHPADQDSYLEDWMTSVLEFRRTAFQALKRLSMSMYYTDSKTWSGIGYHGMFLPENRR